jgi:hypothetical protein
MDTVNASVNDLADSAKRTGAATDREIMDTAQRATAREGAASGAITGDIIERYGALQDHTNRAYGQMRDTNRNTYAGLKASAEDTYDTAFKDVEMLKPGGEFAQARAARSFAPAVASTAGQLRRMGISGPQALSAMQRVEAARARAQDDAAAEGTEKYVGARTELGLSRQGARERLGTGELGNELTLAERQTGITTDLSREQGQEYRGEINRTTGVQHNIDRDRSDRSVLNADKNYTRTQDWIDAKDRAALLDRALQQQDWQTYSNLVREMSDADLQAIGLRRDQFGAGMGFTLADLQEKNAAAGTLGDYGWKGIGAGMDANRTALNNGDTAFRAYQTAYGYEAPQAGYGVKALAAAAAPALDMIAPGSGQALRGGVNGTQGAYGYGAPQNGGGGYSSGSAPWSAPSGPGGYGTGWGGPNNPYQFSYQQDGQGVGGSQNWFTPMSSFFQNRRRTPPATSTYTTGAYPGE